MNLTLLAEMPTSAFILGGVVVIAFVLGFAVFASRYVKVGPNEALIISGRQRTMQTTQGARSIGFRIVKGGATFVWPVFEEAQRISLEMMTIDVKTPEIYTSTGVPVLVDGVAQIKVKSDESSIATAAEQFLSKTRAEMMEVALQTLEGHLRAIVGTLTVEDIYKNREKFAQEVQQVAATDLLLMGLEIISFTLRDIRDNQGYLEALGKPRIAQVRRDAVIAQQQAESEALQKSSVSMRDGQNVKLSADAQVAESQRDLELKKADYNAAVNQKKAESDLAYDLQKYKTAQLVKEQEIKVQVVEKERQIELQEKEISRKERELEATIRKPADAEQYRIRAIADGTQYKLVTEAKGQAEAQKSMGFGVADAERAKGLAVAEVEKAKGLAAAEVERAKGMAEADVIRAKGEAEALAMTRKAAAWSQYNEAAVMQMLIEKLPEVVRAVAEPLGKTDKITIISTGGEGIGASRVTQDVINVVAQLPPLIQSLSGVDLKELIKKVPGLGGLEKKVVDVPPAPETPKKG
ncbi:MAG: flotillin family protein [Planctomycetes bacterium]|nr:flotillin family protein [Planctomycetota bacterium]